jgi:hypothetical protein
MIRKPGENSICRPQLCILIRVRRNVGYHEPERNLYGVFGGSLLRKRSASTVLQIGGTDYATATASRALRRHFQSHFHHNQHQNIQLPPLFPAIFTQSLLQPRLSERNM